MGHALDTDGTFLIRIPGGIKGHLDRVQFADYEIPGQLAKATWRAAGRGRQWTVRLSRRAVIVMADHLEQHGKAEVRTFGAGLRQLVADYRPIRIQNAGVPDGMSDDGELRYQMPYPFLVMGPRGAVLNSKAFSGQVVRVVGFQRDLAHQGLSLLWREANADPSRAVGMYAITQTPAGGWATWQTAVETAKFADDEES